MLRRIRAFMQPRMTKNPPRYQRKVTRMALTTYSRVDAARTALRSLTYAEMMVVAAEICEQLHFLGNDSVTEFEVAESLSHAAREVEPVYLKGEATYETVENPA